MNDRTLRGFILTLMTVSLVAVEVAALPATSDPLAASPLRWHAKEDVKPRDGYYWIRNRETGLMPYITRLDRDGWPCVEWAGPIPQPRERHR